MLDGTVSCTIPQQGRQGQFWCMPATWEQKGGLTFSSMKFKQPSLGTKAAIFFPFLISCTRAHLRIAELGCFASIPLRSTHTAYHASIHKFCQSDLCMMHSRSHSNLLMVKLQITLYGLIKCPISHNDKSCSSECSTLASGISAGDRHSKSGVRWLLQAKFYSERTEGDSHLL